MATANHVHTYSNAFPKKLLFSSLTCTSATSAQGNESAQLILDYTVQVIDDVYINMVHFRMVDCQPLHAHKASNKYATYTE